MVESEVVEMVEVVVVTTVDVLVVTVVVVDVPLIVVVMVALVVEAVMVVLVPVTVLVKDVVVTSHSVQPEQSAQSQVTDHSRLLQLERQLCAGSVVIKFVVVVGSLKSSVPVGNVVVPEVLEVVVGSGGNVYSTSSSKSEGSSVLVRPKLKLYTTGGFVVGRTTLAQASQVPHTHQPHLTNHGWPFRKQSSWHSRGWKVRVVVVVGIVVVLMVCVTDVVVVVVHSIGGLLASANKSGCIHTPALYCSSSSDCCSRNCCCNFSMCAKAAAAAS